MTNENLAAIDSLEVFTVADLVKKLGVSDKTLRKAVKEGRFPKPNVVLGERTLRWSRSAVDSFLKGEGQ